jgi:hypothetical protein
LHSIAYKQNWDLISSSATIFLVNKIKPLHVSANDGHHIGRRPTLQRKCFTCITCMLSCMGYTST